MTQPESISFSPLNWRNICVAYEKEINVYKIEQCDTKKIKTLHNRFVLPLLNDQQENIIFADFKDEFKYPTNSITVLNDGYGEIIDELLDKRERHVFSAICWTNTEEILIATKKNFILKVLSNLLFIFYGRNMF